jgi:DegV family protein with EDD domain
MIRIITDSTCDLPQSYVDRHNIKVVPIVIHFGEEMYLDNVTIDQPTFYRMIAERNALPKTSQPSPGDFATAYREVVAAAGGDCDQILSIHVTGKLSGTCRSAQMAAEMVKDEVPVEVFDSLGGSAGLGYMCIEAARMAEAGAALQEIIARLEHMRAEINIFLTLDNLLFAQMSGRVGKLQGTLASLLNVKPVIFLGDGVLDVTERVRTRRRAVERMLELTAQRVGDSPINLAVVHAEIPEEATALLAQAQAMFNCQESYVNDLALGLAVQFGPGTLGIVTYRV